MNLSEERDLIWLPRSLAGKVKELESPQQMEALILEFIEQSKQDIKISLDSLDESLITYKAQMISARNRFEEAKNKELEANCAMWEKFEDERPRIQEKVKSLISELEPLKKELDGINKSIKNIETYDIERLLKIIKEINSNFYGETANVLQFLMQNYYKTTKTNE